MTFHYTPTEGPDVLLPLWCVEGVSWCLSYFSYFYFMYTRYGSRNDSLFPIMFLKVYWTLIYLFTLRVITFDDVRTLIPFVPSPPNYLNQFFFF